MVKIFISYRRQDSQQIAERIFEKLEPHFPVIFYDLSTISYGNDFVSTIQAGIYDSDVVLVLINRQWTDILKERRKNPEDFVRIEVETALEQRKRVIPILIDNTPMPEERDLPPRIAKNFVKLNAMPMPSVNPFFNTGIDELIKALNDWQSIKVPPPLPPQSVKTSDNMMWRNLTFGSAILAMILGLLALIGFSTREISQIIEQTVEVPMTEIVRETVEVTRVAEGEVMEVPVTVEHTVEVPVTEIVRETVEVTRIAEGEVMEVPVTVEHTVEVPVTEIVRETVEVTSPPIIITATPSPTATLPANPLELAMYRAIEGVSSNEAWEAWYPEGFVQEFDGVPMLLVPTGCFMMGNDDGSSDEKPAHRQCIEKPFWIDQYEVTQSDFERLDGEKAVDNRFDGGNLPVDSIKWLEAKNFCEKRVGRLLTEVEWEYAARGPDDLLYPWGNEWNEKYAVWSSNSRGQTARVGDLPVESTSWVGAYNMGGNVREWVSSLYLDYEYDQSHEDNTDTDSERVVRGGSWNSLSSASMLTYNRTGSRPDDTVNIFKGFRCAKST